MKKTLDGDHGISFFGDALEVGEADLTAIRMLSQSFKFVYYNNWKVIDR